MSNWKQVEKSYFKDDPPGQCWIECDEAVRGSPLWPMDSAFDPARVDKNLEQALALLASAGGTMFWGHVPLRTDRKVFADVQWPLHEARRLETTFISGYFLPMDAIRDSRAGFFIRDGNIPKLSEVTSELSGTWLMSNLGYFLTKKLILDPEQGGLIYSHNSRHPSTEHLQSTDNAFLGGFLVRNKDGECHYPPLLQSGALAIDADGKPNILSQTKLRGGQVTINEKTFVWSADDVNPQNVGMRDVALYTPSFSPASVASGDWKNYRCTIGAGRFNVVIGNVGFGDHPEPLVFYAVQGECLQPAHSVVLSLRAPFSLQRGDVVRFDLKPWCDESVFRNARCIYEGLMPLSTSADVQFGPWMHPHSSLTQETFIANALRREPRTVLVRTDRRFGAIAFSGRYELSLGISLAEIGSLVKMLVERECPHERVQQILSLDGGSAAKLCLICDGAVQALSWPAPGFRNRLGDADGNTYSCLFVRVG